MINHPTNIPFSHPINSLTILDDWWYVHIWRFSPVSKWVVTLLIPLITTVRTVPFDLKLFGTEWHRFCRQSADTWPFPRQEQQVVAKVKELDNRINMAEVQNQQHFSTTTWLLVAHLVATCGRRSRKQVDSPLTLDQFQQVPSQVPPPPRTRKTGWATPKVVTCSYFTGFIFILVDWFKGKSTGNHCFYQQI